MVTFLIPAILAAPPDAPRLSAPADGATGESSTPTLAVEVSDPDGDPLQVRFRMRRYQEPGEDFSLVAMPDTQYYACGCSGGATETFAAQTDWIAEHQAELNIAYVAQLGDCTENGDEAEDEWLVADDAFARFDEGRSEWPLPEGGLPYGVAVGNHDQDPWGDPDGTTIFYNQYFGADRFGSRHWFGGNYGADYDDHYHLFDAGGTSFLVLLFEYDSSPDPELLTWANDVIAAYPDRHVIVVSHYLLGSSGTFGSQGQQLYDALKDNEGLFLMLAGHVHDEANRTDAEGPREVHTLLSDYQSRDNGGDGWLRVMQFSPSAGSFEVMTYSPTLDQVEDDADSAMTLSWDPNPAAFDEVDLVDAADGLACATPAALEAGTTWEWMVEVSDGTDTVESERWTFTTGTGVVVDTGGDSGDTAPPDSPADSGDSADSAPADSPEVSVDCPPPDTGEPIASEKPGKDGGCGRGGAAALGLVGLAMSRRRRA